MEIRITINQKIFDHDQVIELYKQNKWSSSNKPGKLINALLHSHTLVIAYEENRIVGIGNAISDGHLVVYYPHLLVHPLFQGKGIGKLMMDRLMQEYVGFHQHILVADSGAISFYEKCGFERAGQTESMWIYAGDEH